MPTSGNSWQSVTAVSNIFIALLNAFIAAVITMANQNLNARTAATQSLVNELTVVDKFMPYLATGNDRQQRVALIVISTLTKNPDLATQLAVQMPSKGSAEAVQAISQSSNTNAEERKSALEAFSKINQQLIQSAE